jgi:hypothetical protein
MSIAGVIEVVSGISPDLGLTHVFSSIVKDLSIHTALVNMSTTVV